MINGALDYLYNLKREGIKLDLTATQDFASHVGNPQSKFKTIHIAGTNGKGSIASYVYNILRQKYKTGMYTSPHLLDFNERIILDLNMIPDSYIIDFMNSNRDYIENLATVYRNPTFFETTTVMAFKYFADNNADYAAIEVGLGGRLDSTNIINPEVSVIAQIGYEHYQRLGCSLTSIAHEKGGIIKNGKPVVLLDNKPEVVAEITKIASVRNSKLVKVSDYCSITDLKFNLDGMSFKLQTPVEEYHITTSNLGLFQLGNISTAVASMELLPEGSPGKKSIEKGIRESRWPSRFEVISREPLVIMDSSHNPPAAHALVETFSNFVTQKPVLLIGMLDDKDYFSYMSILRKLSDSVILTTPDEPSRSLDPDALAAGIGHMFPSIRIIKDPVEAYNFAIQNYSCVLVTGSMYLVGMLKKYLGSSVRPFNMD
ncbi:bifunctional folylpolyglutamate synthase/dihydrofolate synthase [Ferroplasma acidiphilum]|uniref:bifunctional folylpolyglutamate synthase/dihydrofolate synthase n=1 Tax=Ferroplasma acidiphilum TaxID=74969 RepID=UPI0028152BE2|nr:folylpolyglutamate synthase/dihydrofolate synthase family protein [Ferroplasma acidiphilum]WMT53154.1 MAG: folylpolyglutamate synthase/dihydrofolate synthase family protein [Ferroplasma acidiphilum]